MAYIKRINENGSRAREALSKHPHHHDR